MNVWQKCLHLILIPLLVEFIAAVLIINTKTGAYAEGFAYIPILLILIIGMVVTLFINPVIAGRQINQASEYLLRTMIMPIMVVAAMLIYYTGFWDKIIEPLLPQTVEKIATAGGRRQDSRLESYFTVHDYQATAAEQQQIEDYARQDIMRMSRECPRCLQMNVYYYFIPQAQYDPVNDEISKQRAIAIYHHSKSDGTPGLRKISPQR